MQVEYQIAVYFRLNIDRLRQFHESLGLQYSAYTAGGWKRLITDTFRQQLENALQEETRQYDVADLYGNADVLTTIQNDGPEEAERPPDRVPRPGVLLRPDLRAGS